MEIVDDFGNFKIYVTSFRRVACNTEKGIEVSEAVNHVNRVTIKDLISHYRLNDSPGICHLNSILRAECRVASLSALAICLITLLTNKSNKCPWPKDLLNKWSNAKETILNVKKNGTTNICIGFLNKLYSKRDRFDYVKPQLCLPHKEYKKFSCVFDIPKGNARSRITPRNVLLFFYLQCWLKKKGDFTMSKFNNWVKRYSRIFKINKNESKMCNSSITKDEMYEN